MITLRVYRPDPNKISNVKVTRVVQTREEYQASRGERKTNTEYSRLRRSKSKQAALDSIAVLDMETDPFDNVTRDQIRPFTACLYSDNFEPVIIWEEDHEAFVHQVVSAIEALPGAYTIYAHNGGKFDFMFLLSRIRGAVSFKGRGIMKANIGAHELRDSFHIIPERLASYQKEKFDYQNMRKDKRNDYRKEITEYLVSDCKYLLDLVKGFTNRFGYKLSIGQAAMSEMRKTIKFDRLENESDKVLRPFFFGGRVECLQGRVHAQGHYKLYDVNSMYPDAMANKRHPIGNQYVWRPGEPGALTCFLDLTCENDGALVSRVPGAEGAIETTTGVRQGRFFTTIHEYEMALKYGLIRNVTINMVIDCNKFADFSSFILPLYAEKEEIKAKLDQWEGPQDQTYYDLKKDYTFSKLIQNNAYGKFAQNPRRFKETWLCEPGELPEGEGWDEFPVYQGDDYWVFERPAPEKRFNNVGTAASITGAARAKLMEAIQNALDPIYCDTDSLICRELHNTDLHPSRLGAWDLEAEYSEVIINGKKMYACRPLPGGKSKEKIRSKGVSGLTFDDMLRLFAGDGIERTNFGPTLKRDGSQHYLTRRVRATAPVRTVPAPIVGAALAKEA